MKVVNFSTINNKILWIVMEQLLAQTALGGINMQFAMLHHMAVILFLTLKRVMIDNVVWHLFFMHYCIRWWWNERETVQEREKGWRVKGREIGDAGCREVEEEKMCVCQKEERWRGKRTQNTEYDYMEHDEQKWKRLLETMVQSRSQKKFREQRED